MVGFHIGKWLENPAAILRELSVMQLENSDISEIPIFRFLDFWNFGFLDLGNFGLWKYREIEHTKRVWSVDSKFVIH